MYHKSLSFWFDNDFVIESKYHRKIVVLFLKARILSLQDVVFRSMFFLIYTDLLLYVLLVENLTFRLWKVIVSLLIDDSVEVKNSMATSLCNIMQSISEGKVHVHFSLERICLHIVSHHYALAWLSEHQIRCLAIIESTS